MYGVQPLYFVISGKLKLKASRPDTAASTQHSYRVTPHDNEAMMLKQGSESINVLIAAVALALQPR